jgi:hypothetical protein
MRAISVRARNCRSWRVVVRINAGVGLMGEWRLLGNKGYCWFFLCLGFGAVVDVRLPCSLLWQR